MDINTINFIGYHGTNTIGEKSILRSRVYKYSNKDNDWLGTGVYFFIDDKKERAVSNAYKWSVNKKKFTFYSVLETTVKAKENEIINFNDEDWQWVFHNYREEKIKDTISRGISVEGNKLKFDCQSINEICCKFNIKIVYQQRYIELNEDRTRTKSEVPNCKIMCVRHNSVIDRDSIRVVKKG